MVGTPAVEVKSDNCLLPQESTQIKHRPRRVATSTHITGLNNKPSRARDGRGRPVMAEAIAERVRRYILDGSDEDLRRLLGVAESTREMARSAFRRVGMQEGWHVIDCGCGPIGGLAVTAEMAGAAGRVVGVDFSEPAIQRARSVVAALQLGNVELFAGD